MANGSHYNTKISGGEQAAKRSKKAHRTIRWIGLIYICIIFKLLFLIIL